MSEANYLALARAWESIEYLAEVGWGIVNTAAVTTPLTIHQEDGGLLLAYVNAEWIELLEEALYALEGDDLQGWLGAMGVGETHGTEQNPYPSLVANDLAVALRLLVNADAFSPYLEAVSPPGDEYRIGKAQAALIAYDEAQEEVAP